MISRRKAIVGGLTAGALVGSSPKIATAGSEPAPPGRPDRTGGYGQDTAFPNLLSDTFVTALFLPLVSPYRALDTRVNRFGRQYREDPALEFNVLTDLNDVRQVSDAVYNATVAVAYNLTVTATEGTNGFLTMYPATLAAVPNVSSINWTGPGLDLANGGVASVLGQIPSVKIVCGGPSAACSAHVLLDITGVYVDSTV